MEKEGWGKILLGGKGGKQKHEMMMGMLMR
jgi:hypothetical protein